MRSIIPAALALLAACAGPSQSAGGDPPPTSGQPPATQPAPPPSGGARQVSVEVVQGTASSAGGGEQNARAEGGGGTVVIRGVATTPTPCHKLSGTTERSGSTVTVRISAAADPEMMCIASIGAIPYTATVRGLSAGTYELRVEHTYPGTGWETAAVLQTQVTVR
ncbi:MAG TPA: hypothetical protein VFY65_10855 [Longimicrobium sp.]|nr:hypothetical protein [Longimicrobium sp.]